MKTQLTIFCLFICLSSWAQIQQIEFNQPVRLSEGGGIADESAVLDVASVTKGVLIPRMTGFERNNIQNPAIGLLVYDTNDNALYRWDGSQWLMDLDEDNTNEFQSLSFSGNILSISNGNNVVIPDNVDDADASPFNEIQTLQLNGSDISILNGNTITLPDASSSNEIQNLTLVGHDLSISGGNTVTLIDNVNDADADPTNEFQTISLTGQDLSISDGNTVTIPSGSQWVDGSGDDIFYNDGDVAIGTTSTGGSSLYVSHNANEPALSINNTYTSSALKTGLEVALTSAGTGNKRGIFVNASAGTSNTLSGVEVSVGGGSALDNVRGINARVANSGTAIYGEATSDEGMAAEFIGDVEFHHDFESHNQIGIFPETSGTGDSTSILLAEDDNGTFGMMILYDGGGNDLEIFGKNNSTLHGPHFILDRDGGELTLPGNIAVGGSEFASGFALSVNGKAICEELQIDLEADWPDYVFEDNYELRSLEDTKQFIKENGHLPGIPSAEVIQTEGLPVGDMQKRMMEKIEELTLHMIQLNEDNKALRAEIDELKSHR